MENKITANSDKYSVDETHPNIQNEKYNVNLDRVKRKHKSPSNRLRDLRRLLEYRLRRTLKTSEETQKKPHMKNSTKFASWKFWKKKVKSEKVNQTETLTQQRLNKEHTLENEREENFKQTGRREQEAQIRTNIQVNPTNIYQNLEHALKLSYLEEPGTLTLALRHIVRNVHEKGTTITFTQIEAVDRIALRSRNLPTDSSELLKLVNLVFERRGETLNIMNVYDQFVRAHGRTTFDPRQKWPLCNIHTYHP